MDWTKERHANARQMPRDAVWGRVYSALQGALDEIERLTADRDQWQASAEMACETPADNCQCAGCLLAEERNGGEGG